MTPSSNYRLPATFMQREMVETSNDGMSQFNVAVTIRLRGQLVVARLEEALSLLAVRHEPLRSSFALTTGRVDQVISRDASLALEQITYSRTSRRRLAVLMSETVSEPFDLRRGPLARARLVRLGQRDHILTLALHHAVCDGWSTRVILRDLGRLYQAAGGGADGPPPLRLQFGDYAAWEDRLGNDDASSYWRRHLASDGAALTFPSEMSPGSNVGYATHPRLVTSVTGAIMRRLWDVGRQAGASAGVVLQAALAVSLAEYGAGEVPLGMIYANRRRPDLQPLVGCLFDVVPLRVSTTGNPTFREMVRRTLRAWETARANFMPLGNIVRCLGASGADLPFNVCLNWAPYTSRPVSRAPDSAGGYLELAESAMFLHSHGWSAQREFAVGPRLIYVVVGQENGGVHIVLLANERLFGLTAVTQLGSRLKRAAIQAGLRPDGRIDELSRAAMD